MAAAWRVGCGAIALLFGFVLARPAAAQSLDVRVEGEQLRIAVGNAKLFAGEPLERLRDGASVAYIVRVSALSARAGRVLALAEYRFVVSFDIFEEKFQVSRVLPSLRVASHLSIAAAEAACSDGLELSIAGLGPSTSFWIRWEYEAETPASGGSGGNLGSLIDLFSRKSAREPARGSREWGPYRLSDLPRVAPARSTRNP